MKATIKVQNYDLSFDDTDVIADDYIQGSNPHNVHPWLLHDHGFALAVVFASNLQDALDIAADNGKLDRYLIDKLDYEEYEVDSDSPKCAFLGNADEQFDIDTLGYVELENPPMSFVAIFAAEYPDGKGVLSYCI